MNAVVMAGGRISGPLAEQTGQTIKCLIEFDGMRLVDRILGALHQAETVDRVCLVGPDEIRDGVDLAEGDLWVSDHGSGPANMLAGLHEFAGDEAALVATSDLPFVSAEAIDGMVDRCPRNVGLCYPVFTREEVHARFPHEANSYMPLQDGDLTGSSVLMMSPAVLLPKEAQIQAVFDARKNFVKLVGILGVDIALRLVGTKVFGRRWLSVDTMVRRFSTVAGFEIAVVRGCSPEISLDIDHERDLAEALAHVESD